MLVLSDHGSYLGKSKGQFKISFGMADKPISYIPATKVDGIIIDAKVTISSGAFVLLKSHGIPVIWQDHKEDDGMILQPFNSHGSVEVRRAQYKGMKTESGVIFSAKVVYAACKNKLTTVKRLLRNRVCDELPDYLVDDMERIIYEFTQDERGFDTMTIDLRQYLMNIEAQVTKLYYQIISTVLESHDWSFDRRTRRPAEDPYNALLNYGYAILRGQLTQSLAVSGLDIYGGFLHTDRSGRESLVLDIMEEFRQVAVDEVIIKMICDNNIIESDFARDNGGITITEQTKKIYIPALFDQLDTYFDQLPLSHHLIKQGRDLAAFLRGINPEYQPFLIRVGDPW